MFLFDNKLTNLKQVINNNNLIECNLIQEINKAGQLSFIADLSLYKKIDDGDMIVVHDKDDEYLLFRVVKREALNDRCSILAVEYGYYCLSVVDYIKDYRPKDKSFQSVLTEILKNTGWTLGKVDDFGNYTGTFYYQTPLECLSVLGEAKGCEFKFTVSMANNQITSKRLNVYKHIGKHLHKQFTLGMNALEIVAESDSLDIYKRALGRGKGEEVGNGYGRRIEFTDVVWSKAKGNPVDKPKGQNWVEEEISGDNYTLPADQKPMKIVIFEDETDPAKLLQKTYDWLINNNRPKLQLKTSVAEAGDLNLGDYVFVTRPDINLRYETRVFRIKRNLLNPKLTTVEFGDNIAITPMDKVTNVSNRVDIVDNKIDKVQEDISIVDSTGVKVNYGNSEPKDKKKGDIWFYTTEDGEEILLRWDGEKWVRVVDNKIIEEIETTVDNAMKESEQAKQDALNAVQKVDEAVQKVTETNEKLDQVNIEVGHVTDRVDAVDTNIGSINSTIESINTNVGNINTNIGKINTDISSINNNLKAPNMIAEPEPFPIMSDYPTTQNSQNINGWARMDNRVNNKEITPRILLWFNAKKGTKYTQQIEVRTNGELNSLVFSFYTQANFTHNEVNATIKQIGQGHYIVYASWEATQNGDTRVLDIKRLNFTGTYIEFRHPKLEKGEYTPYYLNGKDTVEALKRLEKTSDGLVAQVGNMQVVQPNLIGNKEPMIQLKCFPNNNQSSNDNGWAKFNNTCSGQEILPVSDISLAVQANKKYTQQVEINTDGTLKGLEFTFFAGGHNVKKANIVNSSTENSYIAYASWTPSANNNLRCIDIRSITIEGATYVKFRHPKIEEGDYTPYTFKDGFNNLSNSMTKVEMTVQGIQSTVQDNTGKITQVTETVDGLNTKVQDNENKITQVTQTAEGLQTTVQENSNKITQVTQTAEGLNSKVQENSNALNGADYNLIESYEITPTLINTGNAFERESRDINGWATFTGSSFANKTLNQVKFKEANGTVEIKPDTHYTVSFEINTNCDIFGDNCYLKIKINDQLVTLTRENIIEEKETTDLYKPESKAMEYKMKYTFVPTDNFTFPDLAVQTARKLKSEYNAYAHVSFRHFQVVEGQEVKDWGKNGGLKDKYTEINQTIEGIQTTVQDNTGKITEVTQTAEGLNSKVEKLENMYNGNRNLLIDANNMADSTYWSARGGDARVVISDGVAELKAAWGGPAYSETKFVEDYQSELQTGQNYTYSLDVLVPNNTTLPENTSLNFYSSIFTNGLKIANLNELEKGKWKRVSVVTQYTGNTQLDLIRPELTKNPTGVVKLRRLKMEVGNKATDYDSVDNDFSEIQQTIEEIKHTVANQNGQISSVQQTVNGVQETVQDNTGKITQNTQTIQGLQQKIQDAEGNINTITSTIEGTTQRIENVEGQITEINNTVDGVEQTVQNQNGQLSSMEQNIEGFKQTVESMVGNISGVNLIGNKDPMIQLRCYPNGAQSSNNNGYAKFTGDCNGQEILPVSEINISKPQGTKITQQIEINTDGTLSALKFTFYNGAHNDVDATIIDKGNGTYIAHASWTFPNENNTRMIDIKSLTASGATYVQFRRPKVEEGEYTPYELSASEVDKVVSTVEQTASGLREQVQDNKGNILEVKKNMQGVQTTVQNNTGEISSLKQQANIMSSKIQDNKNNISQVTQTASNVQTQVSNLENKTNTKFTQIEDMIALQAQKDGLNYPQVSKMKDVQDLYELSDKQTWQDIYVFENTLEDGTLKYVIRVGNLGMSKGEKKGIRLKEYLDVTGASQFTLQFKSVLRANDTSCAKGYCYIVEYDENKRMLANNFNWIKYDYVDTEYTNTYKQVLNPDTKYVRPVYVFESTGKTFDFDLYDFFCYTNTSGLSAQVGIMTDNISLSVKKGEVINAINVSTEGVTIAGNKVHITGQTTIDNAVIKDAMIANISASKITAGTIDASRINVININANNIVGNKTQFVQSAWNSISSNVTISGNGIKAGASGREVRLDSNGLNWKKSDGTGLAYFGNSWAVDRRTESLALISEPGEYIGLAHRYSGDSIATRYLSLEPNGRISFESGGRVGFNGQDAYFTSMSFSGGPQWPAIMGSNKKTGIAMGSQALYLYDENSYMTLNDIRIGKIQGLTSGDAKAKIGAMRVDGGGPWIAITGPDGDSKIVFGGDALYLGDSRGLFSLNTILKACKLR